MYFLYLKVRVAIPFLPNVKRGLDQDQSSQKITRMLPYYTSNYSDYNYGRSKIYMTKIEPQKQKC